MINQGGRYGGSQASWLAEAVTRDVDLFEKHHSVEEILWCLRRETPSFTTLWMANRANTGTRQSSETCQPINNTLLNSLPCHPLCQHAKPSRLHLSTYFPPPDLLPPCPCPCPCPCPAFTAEAPAFLSPAPCALAAKLPAPVALPPVACCASNSCQRATQIKKKERIMPRSQRVVMSILQRTCVDWMRWASDFVVGFEGMLSFVSKILGALGLVGKCSFWVGLLI